MPCVSTPVGGIKEVIDETCGRLACVGDVEGLTEAVREILLNKKMRLALSMSARSRAEERYNFDIILNQYLSCFRMKSF